MSLTEVQKLIDKIEANEAGPHDFKELARLISENDALADFAHSQLSANASDTFIDKNKWEQIAEDILSADKLAGKTIPLSKRGSVTWGLRWYAAAALILFIAGGYWIWNIHRRSEISPVRTNEMATIEPGKDGAILTLSTGKKVLLDTAKNGVVALDNGVIAKLKNGKLSYEGSGESTVFNTLTTPMGRQFFVVLPDNSMVWLNAGSSITYPISFAADDRTVSITGEVYFEITKDSKRPFHVHVNGREDVTVLGTHFNINSYNDEPSVRTTLLEGKVLVKNPAGEIILNPGQQAQLNGQQFDVSSNVNIDEVMAWKNGMFCFIGADIDVIMRQLSRWYGFEVTYKNKVSEKFYVKVDRTTSVSDVFKILEATGAVHFEINDKKISVMP